MTTLLIVLKQSHLVGGSFRYLVILVKRDTVSFSEQVRNQEECEEGETLRLKKAGISLVNWDSVNP